MNGPIVTASAVLPLPNPSACPSRTASWALAYAAMGWRVYPVARGGKRPLFTGWLEDATSEPALIGRWWPRDPGAPNIGVVAGEQFDVIDVEAEHVPGFREAARARGLPSTPIARSGGGGLHLYVAPLGLGTRRLLLHGVHVGELKGSGGVLVPPSFTTGAYAWLRAPSGVLIADAPAWLRALADGPRREEPHTGGRLSPSRAVALVAALYRVVAAATEGERNALLFWASCRAAEHGVDRDAAAEILLSAALKAGLPEHEARATIASGIRR